MRPEDIRSHATVLEPWRVKRICELLSKAVVRDLASRVVVTDQPQPTTKEMTGQSAPHSTRLLSYLQLVGEASPAVMRETLGLSQMQVYRALQPLLRSGRVEARGLSRDVVYVVTRSEADKAALN